MLRRALLTCAFAIALLVPVTTSADGFFVPFYGAAFGGIRGPVDDTRKPASWGVCIGSMGGGIFGFESDISFSPDFYANSDSNIFGDNSVTTVMGTCCSARRSAARPARGSART